MFRASLLLVVLGLAHLLVPPLQMQANAASLQHHAPITIHSDSEFTPANGVVSGDGTASNPYLIENWDIGNSSRSQTGINITGTTAYFVIRSVAVHNAGTGISIENVRNGRIEDSTISKITLNGVYITLSSRLQLLNNWISNDSTGLDLQSSDNLVVSNNTITNGSNYGIFVDQGANFNFSNNSLNNNHNGLALDSSGRMTFSNNTISSTAITAITLQYCNNIQLFRNQVHNSSVGIGLTSTDNALIAHNNITDTQTYAVTAPNYVEHLSNLTIIDNEISNAQTGLLLRNTDHFTIFNNTITSTRQDGLDIRESTYSNLGKNTFVGSNGISMEGSTLLEYESHTITPDNLVNGRPIWFYKDCNSIPATPASLGQLIIVGCHDLKINSLQASAANAGLVIAYSNKVSIENCNFSNDTVGISIIASTDISVNFTVLSGDAKGMRVESSPRTSLHSDTFVSDGLTILGLELQDFNTHTITSDNVVNGNPLYYYANTSNVNIDNVPVGQLILANVTNVRLTEVQISHTEAAIQMFSVRNAFFNSNSFAADTIGIAGSGESLTVSNNIFLSDQTVFQAIYPNLTNSTLPPIDGLTVKENYAINNTDGFRLDPYILNLQVTDNYIAHTSSGSGLTINGPGAIVANNTLAHNKRGVFVFGNSDHIFHNIFIENTIQAVNFGFGNFWDDGYPSGGNRWSDYSGVDDCSGPAQDVCPSPDGIGDFAYYGSGSPIGFADHYPLMPGFFYNLRVMSTLGGSTNPPTGDYTYASGQVVNITATPSNGYVFDRWQLDGANIFPANPGRTIPSSILVSANSNHSLEAVFKPFTIGPIVLIWPGPSSLSAETISPTSMTITWTLATGYLGLTTYRVYKDGVLVATVPSTVNTYTLTGLNPGTTYTITVEACDSSNNCSANGPSSAIATSLLPLVCDACPFFLLFPLALVALFILGGGLTYFVVRRRRTRELSSSLSQLSPVLLEDLMATRGRPRGSGTHRVLNNVLRKAWSLDQIDRGVAVRSP